MLSLSGQSDINGPTFFFKKSHKKRKEINNLLIGFDQYVKNKSKMNFYVANDLNPGDFVLFDVRTWHGRISPEVAGREVIWLSFLPLSNESRTLDSLFKISSLAHLNSTQKKVLNIESNSINNKKNLETQYIKSFKTPYNVGFFGKFIDFLFITFSKKYNSLRLKMQIFSSLNKRKRKENLIKSLFSSKPSGKDIDPKQMI